MSESAPPEPGLTRSQLLRVLALDEHAAAGEIQRRGLQLLRVLRARLEPEGAERDQPGAPSEGAERDQPGAPSEGAERDQPGAPSADAKRGDRGAPSADATRREIERLEAALSRHARGAAARRRTRPPREIARLDRATAVAIVLGVAVAAIAFWMTSTAPEDPLSTPALQRMFRLSPAKLVLTGPLPGATLRVLDADRTRVLEERPAQDAVIELRPGRYAIEVARADCPERWTRSLFLEPGTTRTFAPGLCAGEGRLRVRTNVDGALVVVDGEQLATSDDPPVALPVGEHALRIEKDGHRPHESRIRIRVDETLDVQADLVPLRPGGDGPGEARAPAPPPSPLAASLLEEPEPFDLGELRSSIAPPKPTARASRLLERAGLGALPDGGSTAWHDRVSGEFLRRFDLDGSGRIDRIEESDEISCEYWRETEASFEQGGLGLSMARYYGFDGTEWHQGALGFDRTLRGAAYARMRACGLRT